MHLVIRQSKELLYGSTRVNVNDNSAPLGLSKTYNLLEDIKSSGTPAGAVYIKEDSKSIILEV